jgi:putative membrane protein
MQLTAARVAAAVIVGILAAPHVAAAHTGESSAAVIWSGRAALAVSVLIGVALYAQGRRRLGQRWPMRRTAAAACGAVAVGVALLSPLDAWAETNVAAHMVQHTVLILIAAPLLALGRPLVVMGAVLPRAPRLGRILGRPRPGLACATHGVALWLWHLPPFYDLTLAEPVLHAVAHATLLGTAVFLWWSVSRGRARISGALWLFVTAFHAGGLGALMALSTRPWFHAATLEDQQLAGLVMWVPAGGLLTAIALALLAGWLRAGTRRASALALVAALLSCVALVACSRGVRPGTPMPEMGVTERHARDIAAVR